MTPEKIQRARRAVVVRPVVEPDAASGKRLVASMRRLGYDEKTIARLTRGSRVQPAAQ